jgi:dTDP-4-amino-4,6-dideoxygalactose transaminase
VPFLDLAAESRDVQRAVESAALRVLRSGSYVLGPETEAFEAAVAELVGARHAIGVNSGTDALVLAFRALGIGPGDEVVTTPFSFLATASSVLLAGAKPVFADIDPATFLIDPEDAARRVTPRTKALMPVALYGQPADMGALRALARDRGLRLVDDAAQALGARLGRDHVGTLADATSFSFYPTKNLGGAGDGGMITTDDDEIAAAARALRTHTVAPNAPRMPGFNSRLDAIQAAVLHAKLPHLARWNSARRRNAERYDEAFADLGGVVRPAVVTGAHHVYHQYALRVLGGRRDELAARLKNAGVETRVYYDRPIHRHELFADRGDALPEAERAAREVLCLPISPGLTPDGQQRCVDVIRAFAS